MLLLIPKSTFKLGPKLKHWVSNCHIHVVVVVVVVFLFNVMNVIVMVLLVVAD